MTTTALTPRHQAESPKGATIRVDDLRRTFCPSSAPPVEALRGVTFTIPGGTSAAVTGPSGSGKSTLLHILGGMEQPDSGRVQVDDVRIDELGPRQMTQFRRTVGFVFQSFHLLPAMTALDNVLAPVLPRRVDFDKDARARDLLDQVGLADRADAMPSELSGGQRQRVAIARALIMRPRLILADEPTGALDTRTGGEVTALMLALCAHNDTTVVLATHDPRVAESCGTQLRLVDGTLG